MDERYKLQEQLLVSSLSMQCVKSTTDHHFETRHRKIHNSFGYVLEGSVKFSTLTETIHAQEGDLIFIPEGIQYVSHWDGSPEICFYSAHFLLPKKTIGLWRTMSLQKIDGLDHANVKRLFEEMYQYSQGDESDQLLSLSLFYQLASLVFPHMKINTALSFPQSLQDATAYIEANYNCINSVQQIATACYLSEPRLYHLFKEYLNTSPIAYLNHLRIHKAIELLANPELSIQQIAEQLNFHSEFYFRKTFQKITGMLPSQLRKML